tara:strand:+ start:160391 stop:160681 length:291 start_codon:yes stop_codon:yes gene_type:complete
LLKLIIRHTQAIRIESGITRFQYIYAIALDSLGKTDKAINNLINVHDKYATDTDVLYALIKLFQKTGDQDNAKYYAEILTKVSPWDQDAQAIFNNL